MPPTTSSDHAVVRICARVIGDRRSLKVDHPRAQARGLAPRADVVLTCDAGHGTAWPARVVSRALSLRERLDSRSRR